MGWFTRILILLWRFAKIGFLSAEFMRKYRRHAIVVILVCGGSHYNSYFGCVHPVIGRIADVGAV